METKFKIENYVQKTSEWLAWRKNGVGASEISCILGSSPYLTAKELFRIKKGLRAEKTIPDFVLEKANAAEKDFLEFFEKTYNYKFSNLCASSAENPRFFASFDGIDIKNETILEIKYSTADAVKEVCKGNIKPHHYQQIQWQLMVTGFKKAIYAIVCNDGTSAIKTVERNDREISMLKTYGEEFLKDLDMSEIPEKFGYSSSEDIQNALQEISLLKSQIKELEKSVNEKKKILDLHGQDSYSVKIGDKTFSAKISFRKGSIDYDKALNHFIPNFDFSELDQFRGLSSSFWTFSEK